jgi:hypothetical protein
MDEGLVAADQNDPSSFRITGAGLASFEEEHAK